MEQRVEAASTFSSELLMSAQMTLKRTPSFASTASTIVGEQTVTKSTKLSPAPSISDLKGLENQNQLAKSVPANADALKSFSKAARAIAAVAQKTVNSLTAPKKAVVKEPKATMPSSFELAGVMEAAQQSTSATRQTRLLVVGAGQIIGALAGGGVLLACVVPVVSSYSDSSVGIPILLEATVGAGTLGSAFVGGSLANYISAKIN